MSSKKTRGFEINPSLLDILYKYQFAGEDENSDPYRHLQFFEDICGTFLFDDCDLDKVKIQLFGLTLIHDASVWYRNFCAGAPRTWMDLTTEFLSKFYPERKTYKARRIFASFQNHPKESLYNGYLRFKSNLDDCPHHGLPEWLVLHNFYG